MVHTWIISFCMIFLVFNFSFASTVAARPYKMIPKKLTFEQWLKWVDRSKNSSAIRYYKKQKLILKNQRKAKHFTKNENRNFKGIPTPPFTLERAQVKSDLPAQVNPLPPHNQSNELVKQVQKEEPLAENDKEIVTSPLLLPDERHNAHPSVDHYSPLNIEIAHGSVDPQPPPDVEIAHEHEPFDTQTLLSHDSDKEEHSTDLSAPLPPEIDYHDPSVETDIAEQPLQPEKTDPLLPDLSTGFALSELERLLKCTSCGEEMGLIKKQNSFMKPHLVNGKGVYLSIYDDRQESLAPLSPIPFLKVSSQSTFNYIEDLGVIFIPIDGTYLIKYGFSGDGMHWGEESSSVQLTINETTIIPNSTITSSQDGVMSSHSIILPLKVNDRVRLINSTPTNSLTLTQANPGGVTAYLEMILLK